MANGNTISEIKSLIGDPDAQLTTKTGLRLLLTVSSEMWEKMEHFNTVLEQIVSKEKQQDVDIAELKSHNIIMWVGKNPKAALVLLATFILTVDLFVDLVSWKDAVALLTEIFKKNAGI